MAELSSDFVKQLVAAAQGVELDDVAASRVATAVAQVVGTLDANYGSSLFDTEPAKFNAVLSYFAEKPTSND